MPIFGSPNRPLAHTNAEYLQHISQHVPPRWIFSLRTLNFNLQVTNTNDSLFRRPFEFVDACRKIISIIIRIVAFVAFSRDAFMYVHMYTHHTSVGVKEAPSLAVLAVRKMVTSGFGRIYFK